MTTISGSTTEFPLQSAARLEMTALYQTLKTQDHLELFGVLDTKLPLLAAGSKTISPTMLEIILDLPMVALTPKPTNTLLVAGSVVAALEMIVSATSGISLDVLLLTTLFVSLLDRLFLNGAALESLVKIFSPGVQQKRFIESANQCRCFQWYDGPNDAVGHRRLSITVMAAPKPTTTDVLPRRGASLPRDHVTLRHWSTALGNL